MTIQIPEAVQWLVPIVVGTNWPEGDEDALRRLGEAWEQAATAINEATGDGNAAAWQAMGAMQGEAAGAFAEYWERFVSGDEQFLVTMQEAAEQLAAGCDDAALNIEYTKLSIIAALIILAAQLAAMIAAAWATFGAGTAGVPIAQAATRVTVQIAFRELIRQIAINLAINVGVDAAIQGLQFAFTGRESWDVGNTVGAGISGAAAGIAGAGAGLGSGALGGTTKRHQGLDETWRNPGGSDYTAGPDTQGWRFTTEDGAEVRADVDNPYTGSWNSGQSQHIPSDADRTT